MVSDRMPTRLRLLPDMRRAAPQPRDLAASDKVLVCDKCLRACCWYGEFMCDEAVTAGLKILTVADLRRLDREHEEYWTDEKLIQVYGEVKRPPAVS